MLEIARRILRRKPELVSPLPGEVFLNLGCGDKILPNYINVDVAASRKGQVPDVCCDLRSLSFPDAYADQILSVHVVEHFYQWEIRPVLLEWVRVLKPGGKLILELPNLLNAAKELLRHPEKAAQADREGALTMWVLYGDPAWKDPLMCHRWGYTPNSMKQLLVDLGLEHVRQEPAQFKKREPRDMRIVGQKPVNEKTDRSYV